MKLLVGLGNPGAKYAFNRHNIGFMAVDFIAASYEFGPWRKRFQGLCAEGRLGNEKCLLLKPQTFMNESGRSVGEAVRFFKLDLDDVIVFHDELDLAQDKVRVKTGGGVAGHNGLKSITAHIGNDYVRVRIGIGHPGSKERVHGHVMGDFPKADQTWLEDSLTAISDAAPYLAEGAYDKFQTAVAHWKPDAPSASAQPAAEPKSAPAPAPSQSNEPKGDSALSSALKRWLKS
ncbi:aminoacyl-tRNA hydrolase [Methyloligella sp. 2.7D]|uniref:aminoacyl-tRNA hydrolase n=1 Tax=unclassified Methyloligella TaxID=2625955 RepID=UPI00157C6B61|nr:aminoacyl-tRNA hydrolase [Methyloligella sp. GL2]QKP77029.1 aminoacyl-tRNA hydrolase [Methyloligella sp. GL2]